MSTQHDYDAEINRYGPGNAVVHVSRVFSTLHDKNWAHGDVIAWWCHVYATALVYHEHTQTVQQTTANQATIQTKMDGWKESRKKCEPLSSYRLSSGRGMKCLGMNT